MMNHRIDWRLFDRLDTVLLNENDENRCVNDRSMHAYLVDLVRSECVSFRIEREMFEWTEIVFDILQGFFLSINNIYKTKRKKIDLSSTISSVCSLPKQFDRAFVEFQD